MPVLAAVILFIFTFSNGYATAGYTYVSVTNNTNEKVNIHSTLRTEDQIFKEDRDWHANTLTLEPYETKQVLWFSRNQNVKANYIYQFNLFAEHERYPNNAIIFSFIAKGNVMYGSDISTSLILPNQSTQIILTENGLEKFKSLIWDDQYVIYARTWLPKGGLFNDYHIVIDKPEENIFDTSSNEKISLLTYNTQLMPFYANVKNDLNQPDVRALDIAKKIGQYDVVILQELFDRDLRIKISNALKANYPYRTDVVGQRTNKAWTGGVIIFSKWPIIKEDQIVYQDSTGIDGLAAKGAVYAAIDKDGKIYHIIGTHAQAGGGDEGVLVREKQFQEVMYFVDRLNIPRDQPLLFGGDFNIDQFGPHLHSLLDILNVNLLDNLGYSYSADSRINTMLVGTSLTRIDYVFYSNHHAKPKTALNKVFILRDLDNEAMWPKFDLSDHFPVVSYFDFSNQGILSKNS